VHEVSFFSSTRRLTVETMLRRIADDGVDLVSTGRT